MSKEYNAEHLLKNRKLSREEYSKIISNIIVADSNTVKELKEKEKTENLSDEDNDKLIVVAKNVEYISSLSKILPKATLEAKTLLVETKQKLQEMVNIFEFTPPNTDSSLAINIQNSLNKTNTPENTDEIIFSIPGLSSNIANSVQKYTNNLADDLRANTSNSTLEIRKQIKDKPGVPGDFLYDIIEIDDSYSVSFNFRLNKFPSKVYQDNKNYAYHGESEGSKRVKKFTTRRSDLISFNYEEIGNNDNKIEFAAIAPFGLSPSEISKRRVDNPGLKGLNYDNKFNPFSIAASITNPVNGKKFSIYTDYKFSLGVWYNVTLKIEKADTTQDYLAGLTRYFKNEATFGMPNKNNLKTFDIYSLYQEWQNVLANNNLIEKRNAIGRSSFTYLNESFTVNRFLNYINRGINFNQGPNNKFGNCSYYHLTMTVNGMDENVAISKNKVWGTSSNSLRKEMTDPDMNQIATLPGFKSINLKQIKNFKKVTAVLDYLDFTKLESIVAVPYTVKSNKSDIIDNSSLYTEDSNRTYTRLYNNYLHRMNHGVDFGAIKIYYKPRNISVNEVSIYNNVNISYNTKIRNLSSTMDPLVYHLQGFYEGMDVEVSGLPRGISYTVNVLAEPNIELGMATINKKPEFYLEFAFDGKQFGNRPNQEIIEFPYIINILDINRNVISTRENKIMIAP
jgi:hypothetical protein